MQVKCSCPNCKSSYTVEIDLYALAQSRGEIPEVATGRLGRAMADKTPFGINVKCPRCTRVSDIAVASVGRGFDF